MTNLFEPTGTIEVRRRSHGGAIAEWKGGRVVEVSRCLVKAAQRRPQPDLYTVGKDRVVIGGFRLLLIGVKFTPYYNYQDIYLAMRDTPLAVCAKVLRNAAYSFLYRFVRVEAYFRSYGIPELVEGKYMPTTAWLGKLLL